MKDLAVAIKTSWSYIANIPRSLLGDMPMDCMNLGAMAGQIKSFSF